MKKMIFTLVFLLSNIAIAAGNVAVIDMEKVMQSTPAGQNAKKTLEAEYAKNKTAFEKKEKALEAEAKDYESKKEALSPQQQEEREKALGEKMAAFEKELQESEAKIQEQGEKLTKPILEKVQTAVNDLSKAKGYTVVLEKSANNVFWSSSADDITDQIIKAVR